MSSPLRPIRLLALPPPALPPRGSVLRVLLVCVLAGVPAVPAEASPAAASLVAAPPVAASPAAAELWEPPLGRPLLVSEPFRAPPHRYGAGHRGIDLPAASGQPVLAPADGTVSFVGRVADRDVVTIRVDERTAVSFEPVEPPARGGLSKGDAVARGQTIGMIGLGGHCDGACLHLGVRVDGEEGEEYVDPMRFFLARPVLLPWHER